jgi:hypothetical protein
MKVSWGALDGCLSAQEVTTLYQLMAPSDMIGKDCSSSAADLMQQHETQQQWGSCSREPTPPSAPVPVFG